MYIYYNPNPYRRTTSDCVIRAITKLTNEDWDTVFLRLSLVAYEKKDGLEKNYVWGAYLKRLGFKRRFVPDTCPDCYTVAEFCRDHPYGVYLLRIDGLTDGHVVTVVNGDWYDSWDSGNEVVDYYYWRA